MSEESELASERIVGKVQKLLSKPEQPDTKGKIIILLVIAIFGVWLRVIL